MGSAPMKKKEKQGREKKTLGKSTFFLPQFWVPMFWLSLMNGGIKVPKMSLRGTARIYTESARSARVVRMDGWMEERHIKSVL